MRVRIYKIPPGEEEYAELYVEEETSQIERLANYIEKEKYMHSVLLCRLGNQTFRVPSKSICYIEMIEGTANVHVGSKIFESPDRLYELERKLPSGFVRVSKSVIINLEKVSRYSPVPGGLMKAGMSNGEDVYISRKYLRDLRDILKEGLR